MVCAATAGPRTGLRQIFWNDWVFSVNGERLFLRGTNLMPITVGLGDTDDELIERDLGHVLDLGLNTIRVHGHIGRRRLYDRADELGLLILQDFPLERTHARSVRTAPSPRPKWRSSNWAIIPRSRCGRRTTSRPTPRSSPPRTGGRRLRDVAAQQLPTWNKTVLDRWVKRALERNDPSRTTIAHSGVLPHFPQLDGTDSHLWFGWRRGEARDLDRLARRMPRAVRFVSEFGSDSIPDTAPFFDRQLREHQWPNLDWEALSEQFGYQRDLIERLFPPGDFESFDDWRTTLQLYQSYVLRVQIESLRRLKYRPTGGFCFSSLADPAPNVSASVLDHERVPKDAYATVQAACATVIVVADLPPDWVSPGDDLRLDLHVVSDRRDRIDDARVDVTARWAGGTRTWAFGGPVDADDVAKVGTIRLTVPDTLGELVIELLATEADGQPLARNRYTTAVTLPPD